MADNAKYFAKKGFIGITISYRSLKISEKLTVCDILEDCEDAIYFMREHLKFINFENIIYMGDSAGGYIAVMLGISQNTNIRPYGVVALNPVTDICRGKWQYGFKNCENIKKFSPVNVIGKDCARFLFLHGTNDTVVEISDTVDLHKKLIEYGHSSEIILVTDAKHAFILYDYQYPDEYVTELMDKIIKHIKYNWR